MIDRRVIRKAGQSAVPALGATAAVLVLSGGTAAAADSDPRTGHRAAAHFLADAVAAEPSGVRVLGIAALSDAVAIAVAMVFWGCFG
jgi:hypothetical protein